MLTVIGCQSDHSMRKAEDWLPVIGLGAHLSTDTRSRGYAWEGAGEIGNSRQSPGCTGDALHTEEVVLWTRVRHRR